MKVIGKLRSAVVLRGSAVIKPGMVAGDLDGALVWVQSGKRRIGVPVSAFAGIEEAAGAPLVSTEEQERQVLVKAARANRDPVAALAAFRLAQAPAAPEVVPMAKKLGRKAVAQ
ncbi:MAG TPA: hypothetical protein VFB66_01805 [Tepidisphaeraceae bacterium]|nr:hypothetical protein [Tepidisphaeraceae bacterium]